VVSRGGHRARKENNRLHGERKGITTIYTLKIATLELDRSTLSFESFGSKERRERGGPKTIERKRKTTSEAAKVITW